MQSEALSRFLSTASERRRSTGRGRRAAGDGPRSTGRGRRAAGRCAGCHTASDDRQLRHGPLAIVRVLHLDAQRDTHIGRGAAHSSGRRPRTRRRPPRLDAAGRRRRGRPHGRCRDRQGRGEHQQLHSAEWTIGRRSRRSASPSRALTGPCDTTGGGTARGGTARGGAARGRTAAASRGLVVAGAWAATAASFAGASAFGRRGARLRDHRHRSAERHRTGPGRRCHHPCRRCSCRRRTLLRRWCPRCPSRRRPDRRPRRLLFGGRRRRRPRWRRRCRRRLRARRWQLPFRWRSGGDACRATLAAPDRHGCRQRDRARLGLARLDLARPCRRRPRCSNRMLGATRATRATRVSHGVGGTAMARHSGGWGRCGGWGRRDRFDRWVRGSPCARGCARSSRQRRDRGEKRVRAGAMRVDGGIRAARAYPLTTGVAARHPLLCSVRSHA